MQKLVLSCNQIRTRFRPKNLGLQVLSLQGRVEVLIFQRPSHTHLHRDAHIKLDNASTHCVCVEMAKAQPWIHQPADGFTRDASQTEKLCWCSKAAQWLRDFSWSDPNPKHNSPSCLDLSLPGGSAAHTDPVVRGCNSHEAHLLCCLNTWTAPARTVHPLFLHEPK